MSDKKKTDSKNSAPENSPAANTGVEDMGSGGNVDQIREILFGGQMRDYDQRFSRVEERLSKEIQRLRENLERRVDDLETDLHKELNKLSERLQDERDERIQGQESLVADLKDAEQALSSKITALTDRTDKEAKDLREAMRNQGREQQDALRAQAEDQDQALQREANRLEDIKVSREALAGLFTEVALRLRQEFELPQNGVNGDNVDKDAS